MFVAERQHGNRALVWRSTPPAPPPPNELWVPGTVERHPSDGPQWAPEFTIHQLLRPRTVDDAAVQLAEFRHRISTTPAGGALARFLQHRPARPAPELGVPAPESGWANVLVDSIQARACQMVCVGAAIGC